MAKLPQESYDRIRKCNEFILENMVNPDKVVEYLFSEDVLSYDHTSEIEAKVKGRQRVKKLLDIIMNECNDCYDQFLEALRKSGFAQVADKIDSGNDDGRPINESIPNKTERIPSNSMPNRDRKPDIKPNPNDSRPINRSIPIKTEPIPSNSMPNRDRKPDIKTTPTQVQKGQMRSDHYDIWVELHEYVVTHFSVQLRELTKKMVSENIISEDDMEIINREAKETSNLDGATKLVEILGGRGDLVLPRIKNALKNINNKVADMIEDRLDELDRD